MKVLSRICFLIFLVACTVKHVLAQANIVFPAAGEPILVTTDTSKAHLFASYYGINSWSNNQQYITVLETSVTTRIPASTDTAILGLVDLRNNQFIAIAKTTAWNFQQGCMAHWLATSPDSLIIYNDYRKGKLVSIVLNVFTKKEVKVFPHPVAAVSPDGRSALSLNFSRLRITRADYGYDGNGQDAKPGEAFPKDDGIFLMNLQTGETKLIISLADLQTHVPGIAEKGIEYIAHMLFNRNGKSIFFLARAIPQWNTTAFTLNADGTNLQRCFPEGWGGSHFDWLNNDELMITANYEGKQYGHILFTPGRNNFKRLGKGLLDYDGHGTFSPNEKWMVTDTYPNPNTRDQMIYLLNMNSQAVIGLGRFREPMAYTGGWRCDIHCRWSPKGDMIGFNSTHSGTRQVYLIKLPGI
ncbi:MAG: hypothetical protein ABIO55_15425 [Ginsengibacter sp.]